ncbi:unnamed protein product [Closterium sp. NIES-54]
MLMLLVLRVPVTRVRLSLMISLPSPGASEPATALGASAFVVIGASESAASSEALHTFTLDSSASRCFFRDCTTVTPLAAPVPVSLAEPSGGPVDARGPLGAPLSSRVCQSPPSLFQPVSTASAQVAESGQVAASSQVSASGQLAASCSCRVLSHKTLLWHHHLGHPSLPRLRNMHSHLLVSGLYRSMSSLPRSLALPCLPCVKGRHHAAPHSFSFPPTTAPLQTLRMDVWGPAPVRGMDQECYFLLVVDDYTRCTTDFPLRRKADVRGDLIPWIRAIRHQLCERFRRDLSVLRLSSDRGETSPTLHWTGEVGDVSAFRGPAPSGVSQVDPPPLVELLVISSDTSGPAEGGDPAADDTATSHRSPCLETPPGFLGVLRLGVLRMGVGVDG